MIKSADRFTYYFNDLYLASSLRVVMDKTFEEIFASNQSRIEFIDRLFDEYENGTMNSDTRAVFMRNIDYIYSFINGKEKSSSMTIPEKYYKDQSIGAIIPSIDELEFLLKLIEKTTDLFDKTYDGNKMYLKLPDESFNENMTRVLEIKKHNIAHLLGLTEYENIAVSDPSKNLLKKHFYSVVIDKDRYYGNTDAEKLLNWINSIEGKEEIRRIHTITLEFVNKDKKANPNSYVGGNLKADSSVIAKFKERYKKETGLDYPIINFSRLITKTINTFNFLKLSNLVEVILDYNAPKGKSNEKDIFLVNRNSKKLFDTNSRFMDMRTDLLIDFYNYAYDSKNKKLRDKLLKNGINVNSQNIRDQLNIIEAYSFIGEYGIEPDDSIVDDKIIEAVNGSFERNVNLIGFNTEFNDEKDIPLSQVVIHDAHCDTSIGLTVPELIGHYYKYGRTFFLDKIESEKGMVMVSNVNDEIYYLKRVIDIKKEAAEQLLNLIELKERLKEKYNNYLREKKNRRW